MIEFGVLGPLRVVVGDEVARIASGRRTVLLSRLLLDADAVVSRDALVDAIWGERPPRAATNALEVQVHALRKVLGADRLVTSGSGYRLVVGAGELDAARFEQLVSQGRAELDAGHPEAASDALGQALRLWRGDAYQDVVYEPFAQVEAARLEEQRIAATEDRIDADLTLGRHSLVVAEIQALRDQHPTRERICRQLMLALYRTGRQEEATRAFDELRHDLLDKLGLDPAPETQALYGAILRQDPQLTVEPAELRARRHLPAWQTAIVGREDELAKIGETIRGRHTRLLTLTGPGGIGKTRLALQAAHDLVDIAADGAYFVGLADVPDPALVPSAILRTLEIDEPRGESAVAAIQHYLHDREVLLLLDNFEVVDAAAPLVAELLRSAPRLVVLVTSRSPLRLSGEHEHRVHPLAPDDAVALFEARAAAVAPSFRRHSDPDAVAALCRRLDGMPLAIELAAARTRDYSVSELIGMVTTALDLVETGLRDLPPRHRSLRATIGWSVDLLDRQQRVSFSRLGVFTGGFDTTAAHEVCGVDRQALADLASASLVHERPPGPSGTARFILLGAVREYALEILAATDDGLEELGERHADYFSRLVDEVELLADERGDREWRALDPDVANLRAALRWWHRHGRADLALRVSASLAYYWTIRDFLHEGLQSLEAALAACQTADAARAKALAGLARLCHSLGDYRRMESAGRESLVLYRQAGDQRGTALALTAVGNALVNLGDGAAGIEMHREAADIYRAIGHARGLAIALNNIGHALLTDGAAPEASAVWTDALPIFRSLDQPLRLALLLGNLGLASVLDGRPGEAIASFLEDIDICRAARYTEGLVYAFVGLAAALSALGVHDLAAMLVGAVNAALARLGLELEPLERGVHERTAIALPSALGDGVTAAFDTGAALTVDEAVELALSRLRPDDRNR